MRLAKAKAREIDEMTSYIPAELRRLVAERAAGRCEYCRIKDSDTFYGCQIDHIIAEKHDGETVESNLAFTCTYCNRFKALPILAQSQNQLANSLAFSILEPTNGPIIFNFRTFKY